MSMSFPKWAKICIAIVIILVAGFAIAKSRLFSADVAPAFEQARMQGAIISDTIVRLSNDISNDLTRVSELDHAGNPRDALSLTVEVQAKAKEVRERANELSEELKKMISAMDSIKSPEAKQAAMEAVTNQMAIISRLISYSEYLQDLSQVLSNRFTGGYDKRSVSVIISQVNAEVTAVNSFNKQAVQAMERFEAALKVDQ